VESVTDLLVARPSGATSICLSQLAAQACVPGHGSLDGVDISSTQQGPCTMFRSRRARLHCRTNGPFPLDMVEERRQAELFAAPCGATDRHTHAPSWRDLTADWLILTLANKGVRCMIEKGLGLKRSQNMNGELQTFFGIPYAEPPVGVRRFLPPGPPPGAMVSAQPPCAVQSRTSLSANPDG